MPLILAFDTSAACCAVALLQGGRVVSHIEEPMHRGQAERLMVLCQEFLASSSVETDMLSAIGVGIGPGNFTGIRISVAAARGMAFALQIPAVGVSAFEALRLGQDSECLCAVTAPRDQAYAQFFSADGTPGDPYQLPQNELEHAKPRVIGACGQPPTYPRAVAIGMIATDRYKGDVQRPAPLYLRAADAAPARDAPPKILT